MHMGVNFSSVLPVDDLLNIDNVHFEYMVHRIYPAELQLNKANASDTEAAVLDLNLSIHNDIVSTKIYKPRCEKTGLRGFRPGPIQTGLRNH